MQWPPNYKITISSRAKNVYLRISPEHGLVCVVPKRYNQRLLGSVIDGKKPWIQKHLLKLEAIKKMQGPAGLPQTINLIAIAKQWEVNYLGSNCRTTIITNAKPGLTIIGKVENKNLCHALLITWLKQQADMNFNQLLQQYSAETGLSYNTLSIRNQKTRWGSCSAKKNISLNFKLLFLPPTLMRYVLIHELCHTKHLNHSERFWKLISKYDAQWKFHDRQLKAADKFIPAWISSKF